MEGGATRPCANCKKNIPEDNYTLHSIYCLRNLRICQQCKEPIAVSDMEKHTAQVSCQLCGENMQACDLPAHKTDACSLTQVCCQYCELMLERRCMADHEIYCGTRTEKCSECSELVMFKYKKLHEDSNHSFLKLDDEPGPVPSWKVKQEKPKPKPTFNTEAMQNFLTDERFNNAFQDRCKNANTLNDNVKNLKSVDKPKVSKESLPFASTPPFNSTKINSNSDQTPSNNAQLPSTSRGAIKKRIAPLPPTDQTNRNHNLDKNIAVLKPFMHTRDVPMYHAMTREQAQMKAREEQNRLNAENGLPPILTTAEKVEKLQRMSDLQNFDYDEYARKSEQHNKSNKNKGKLPKTVDNNMQNGYAQPQNINQPKSDKNACSTSKNVNVKTDKNNKKKCEYLEFSSELGTFISADLLTDDKIPQASHAAAFAPQIDNNHSIRSPKRNVENEVAENNINRRCSNDLQIPTVKKSKPPQSNDRVESLIDIEGASNYTPNSVDRFSDIKNSLTALRKEFKNCTTPYETKNLTAKKEEEKQLTKAISPKNDNVKRNEDYNPVDLYRISNDIPTDLIDVHENVRNDVHENVLNDVHNDIHNDVHNMDSLNDVLLPCEFCEEMIQASELVMHETGCRPNLTSFSENNLPKLKRDFFAPPNTPDTQYGPKVPNSSTKPTVKVPAKSGKKGKGNKNVSILLQNSIDSQVTVEVDEVKLPCEFCMTLVAACRLQWHQRNCLAELTI